MAATWPRKKMHPGIWIATSPVTGRKSFVVRIRMPGYLYEKCFKTYGEAIQARYMCLRERPPIRKPTQGGTHLRKIRIQQIGRKFRKEMWKHAQENRVYGISPQASQQT